MVTHTPHTLPLDVLDYNIFLCIKELVGGRSEPYGVLDGKLDIAMHGISMYVSRYSLYVRITVLKILQTCLKRKCGTS